MAILHGTTIELNGHGIFIIGTSGMGKSDLAICLMDRGARLVSDDYTEITVKNNILTATAPKNIKNRVEVHGIGIIKVKSKSKAKLSLVVQLIEEKDLERMPEEETIIIEDISLPKIYLCAKHSSAVAKLCLYLKYLA
jgi:serine kinase of HPr protein (carbohydrate metabolism regulator)